MDIQHQLVQIRKNVKSGLVQISLFWQIWTSPDLAIFEIWTNSENVFSTAAGPDSQKVKSGLVQISILEFLSTRGSLNRNIFTRPNVVSYR